MSLSGLSGFSIVTFFFFQWSCGCIWKFIWLGWTTFHLCMNWDSREWAEQFQRQFGATPLGIIHALLIETLPETSHASRLVMNKCVLHGVTICPHVTLISMAHFAAALLASFRVGGSCTGWPRDNTEHHVLEKKSWLKIGGNEGGRWGGGRSGSLLRLHSAPWELI